MDNEDVIVNAVTDEMRPDLLYPYIPMDGAEINSKSRKSLDRTTRFSQYSNKDTYFACTVYGTVHTKHDTENKVTLDPRDLWLNHALARGGRQGIGWSMNGVIKMFRDLGYIRGYTASRTVDMVKSAIDNSQTVVTGTRNCDFGATRLNDDVFVYTTNGPGHIFEICGYDNDKEYSGMKGFFEIKNSSHNTPTIWVAYEQFKYLYTCIVLIVDIAQMQMIKETVEDKTIAKAIYLGITNGDNLQENLTRKQLAIMIGRIIYGIGLSDDSYLNKTMSTGIWNGKGGDEPVIRMNALIMIGRALIGSKIDDGQAIKIIIDRGITNGSRLDEACTRLEGILLVTRLRAIKNDSVLA